MKPNVRISPWKKIFSEINTFLKNVDKITVPSLDEVVFLKKLFFTYKFI
jgi:hypothetical protein